MSEPSDDDYIRLPDPNDPKMRVRDHFPEPPPARDQLPPEERRHADLMDRLDRIADALEVIAERLS
jgi:hypothetical protein